MASLSKSLHQILVIPFVDLDVLHNALSVETISDEPELPKD
jgi:hypothetical protein